VYKNACLPNSALCEEGSFANIQTHQCELIQCKMGSIWNYAIKNCSKCKSNHIASLKQTSCYENASQCENGSFANYQVNQCIACPQQHFSSVNHSSCSLGSWNCEPGSYGNSNLSQCFPCENGLYIFF
jgi:hypothetical protein